MYGSSVPTIRNGIIAIKVENVIKRSTVVLSQFHEFDNCKQKCKSCLRTIVHLQKKAFKCNFQTVTSHRDIKLKLLKQTIK